MSERQYESIIDMFHHRVELTPKADAMYGRRGGEWYTLNWQEVAVQVRAVACGLRSLGVDRGNRCSILAITRPEWVIADLGILAAGGATTTIYPSNTPEECAYIIQNSGSLYCIAENPEMAEKLIEVRDQIPDIRKVILIDGDTSVAGGDDWLVSWDELISAGQAWDQANPGSYSEMTASLTLEDLATLIYTSGTTGQPKGVMLNHSNWVYEATAIADIALLSEKDTQFLFLPLAHSFAKVLQCAFIATGCPTACDGNIDDLLPNIAHVRPTVMAAVPRIFEKVYNKVIDSAKEGGPVKYGIFRWAVGVGREVSKAKQRKESIGGFLSIKNSIADKLVFSKLKDRFGGRIRFFVSGGAPLSREIAEFFHASDLLILEGYGLTESSAATFVNRPEQYKFGTVGLALPKTEVQIAEEDGEILVRGGGIMQGYYNRPEDTAATLNAHGWLQTGDVGELDSDGFLRITDRKKDIIVTAGGKNVAPQNVENQLKATCPYVSQVVMLGDQKPYCIALITINDEIVGKWAKTAGLTFTDYADLASKPEVKDLIWKAVEAMNADLASYESIKKIAILDHDLSIEGGELTPKMSIKRKIVEKNNEDLIDSMYGDTVQEM